MKVRKRFFDARTLVGAALVVVFSATLLGAPAPAHSLTREQIIKRATVWVKKKVSYSQARYYKGYRRDCSGFVSMAWKLNKSYTTRTISSRAKRISVKSLKPGDAVLTRGHVAIFGGWKNKSKRTYWALEQTTWGSHAKKRVRSIPRGAKALRRKNLAAPKKVAVAKPKPQPVAPSVVTSPVEADTASLVRNDNDTVQL